MPITPDLPFPKGPGDAVRSKDWNDLVLETQRLDEAKLDRAGDTITGTLTVDGALGVGTAGAAPAAKLQVVGGAIMPATGNTAQNGILFPPDPGSGAGDSAWLRHYARIGESTTLEIGTSNDADDHIALMPSGSVGIGTLTPAAKLDVIGNALIQGDLTVNGSVVATGPVFSNPLLGIVTDLTPQTIAGAQTNVDMVGTDMTIHLPFAHRVRVTLTLAQVSVTSFLGVPTVLFHVVFTPGPALIIGSFSNTGTFANLSFSVDIDLPAGPTSMRVQWSLQAIASFASATTADARTLSVSII